MKKVLAMGSGVLLAGLVLLSGGAQAATVTYGFIENSPGNSSYNVSGQLSLEVTQTDSDVSFKFINGTGIDSVVTSIWFGWNDNPWLNPTPLTVGGAGGGQVNYTGQSGNGNSPGFNPDWHFSPDSPPTVNGLNDGGEWLTVNGTLTVLPPGQNIFTLIQAGLDIGLHVQSLPDGQSEKYRINPISTTVGTVPLPAAFWLFGSALFAGMGVLRKKKI